MINHLHPHDQLLYRPDIDKADRPHEPMIGDRPVGDDDADRRAATTMTATGGLTRRLKSGGLAKPRAAGVIA